jgi:PAS domain S-box-containing protein
MSTENVGWPNEKEKLLVEEKALRENEKKYRVLVENAADIIYSLDTMGNIVSVNKALKEMLGFEPEEVIGTNIGEYMPKEVVIQKVTLL